jgi:hypothetical protein
VIYLEFFKNERNQMMGLKKALNVGPSPKTHEEVVEKAVTASRLVGSPTFPLDEDEVRKRTGLAYDR